MIRKLSYFWDYGVMAGALHPSDMLLGQVHVLGSSKLEIKLVNYLH